MNMTVPPRIYPKHKVRLRSITAYRACNICKKEFDGTLDVVMYGVPGPDGGELQEMAHVACVPALDLSEASTFKSEAVGDANHRVTVAKNIAGDGKLVLELEDTQDAMLGKLDDDKKPRPV